MKKAFLLLSLAAGTYAASAHSPQQHEDFKFFKPKKGDVTAEAGLVGGILNSDFALNNNAGMLRGRYFLKNNFAFRLGLNLSVENTKDNVYGPGNASGYTSTTNTGFLINLGVEKHFKGTARLSPYVGGDLLLGIANARSKSDADNGGVYQANFAALSKQSDFSLGLRGVIGADYYIAPRVYLGGELGLGVLKTWAGETYTEVNGTVTTAPSAGSELNFGPSVVTGVRIGFVF